MLCWSCRSSKSIAFTVNPRRACARLSCVSVYLSVPALAAGASVETSKQRVYFWDFDRWIFERTFCSRYGVKKPS